LSIEAPRLGLLLVRYQDKLRAAKLPSMTADGYPRSAGVEKATPRESVSD
jgi:hypothetical protein